MSINNFSIASQDNELYRETYDESLLKEQANDITNRLQNQFNPQINDIHKIAAIAEKEAFEARKDASFSKIVAIISLIIAVISIIVTIVLSL